MWCANPENLSPHNQWWFDETLCVGTDSRCDLNRNCCKQLAIERRGTIVEKVDIVCPIEALSPVAHLYSADELYLTIIRDKAFWKEKGGVTFSGGEPLLQIDALIPVLKKLKREYVHIAFETAGFVKDSSFLKMLEYADLVYLDIKNVIDEHAPKIHGGKLDDFLGNLSKLAKSGITYTLRMPVIKPYTYYLENLKKISDIIKKLSVPRVEIFSCHNLGINKSKKIGCPFTEHKSVSQEELRGVQRLFEAAGAKTEILFF